MMMLEKLYFILFFDGICSSLLFIFHLMWMNESVVLEMMRVAGSLLFYFFKGN
jgi:hypothetical protein